jgi:signal transduction histidine kinase
MINFNELRQNRFRLWLKPYTPALIRVSLAIAIAFIIVQFKFDYIESFLYDIRMRARPTSAVSGHVQTIAIDPLTIDSLHRAPNAADHIQLLERLKAAEPRVVIYLINPGEITGSYEELKSFADIAQSFPHFIVAIPDVWPKSQAGEFKQAPPFEKLHGVSAPSTSDLNLGAKDDVTRRMFISFEGQPTMDPQVAALYNPEMKFETGVRGLFPFYGSNQILIAFHPAKTYRPMSFVNAQNGKWQENLIRDHIVLVGRDLQLTAKDYVRTPYSRDVIAMSLLELHANMLDTLILNSAYVSAPHWLDFLLTIVISILTVYVVLEIKPTRGLMILGTAISIFWIFCYLFFWLGGVWIGMAHPVLSIFIGYYFFIPYRLIIENRRSWEYYQKNRLLTQVEELKTNFLSMMSHDLKTPIARIQGMTDIVLKDANPLSERQKEALLTLDKSSEDLLQFVSSILNLGRIESKEIKLHLESKDPTSLLLEVVQKYEFIARQKNIDVITEFEPVFSLRMDVDLIRQVFSNLLENALKYSPDNSKVLISTEESNGYLIVQFADQGLGIPSDELGNIFMKFYRSKDAKSSIIKGSGLGLYLARYFVGLHQGRVSVDSTPGQGSTFTVELPMNLEDVVRT